LNFKLDREEAYGTYVSELTELGQMIFSGYQTFLTRAGEQLPNAGDLEKSASGS
jgi:hypothetical protein